jgi:predicted SAM-dependent methyltransferase
VDVGASDLNPNPVSEFSSWPAPDGAGLKLNLGCGHFLVDGWVNIDKSPSVVLARFPRLRRGLGRAGLLNSEQERGFPRGIVHADVGKHIPVADGAADFAYSSHMIEHLSRWQGLAFVRECRRVLRPGGVLRLATPDLALLVSSYLKNEFPEPFDQMPTAADSFVLEYGAYFDIEENTAKRLVRRLASPSIHQWLYDFDSLSCLLEEGGFTDVTRTEYRAGSCPDLDQLELRPRSLFVEAR